MALEKIEIVDRIEVVESGVVQVRVCTRIVEDGKQISSTYHRHALAPGDDYSNEDSRVRTICATAHTSDVVAAYQASVAQSEESAA